MVGPNVIPTAAINPTGSTTPSASENQLLTSTTDTLDAITESSLDSTTASSTSEAETSSSEIATTSESSTEESSTSEPAITSETKATETSQSSEASTETSEEKANPRIVGEALVGTWADFVAAVRNETVTKITLTASFENPKSTDSDLSSYSRKNDLEIDGKDFRVDFKSSSIQLGTPANAIGQFTMHDIVLNQDYGGANSEDIVGSRLNYTAGGKWKYRFGNITTEPGVQRLARASHAEVTIYGKMDIDTRAENFYLGSLKMEDGTVYKGNVNYYNFSIFWYNVAASATSTGKTREFTVGKNCKVTLTQSQTSGTTYPAVYHHYQALTIGEGSTFNVNMPGNAVRFDDEGAGMTVKTGAVINLTSKKRSGSVIAFSDDNTYMNVESGSYFYVIGNSTQPLINLSANGTGVGNVHHTGNTFAMNTPAQYDIRNLVDGETAVQVDSGNYGDNKFSIIDSDIDLWKTATPAMGPSDETYAQVPSFEVTGHGTKEVVTTGVAGLNQFKQDNYRRISGMNQKPELAWDPVTDADKTVTGRVIIGYVPDNEGSASGTVNYIPVYASANQAQVDITDSLGTVKKDVPTDAQGYAKLTGTNFQKKDGIVSGLAKRSSWIADAPVTTKVLDVTPPEPAVVDNVDKISTKTTKLSGTGEPNSLLHLTINDQDSGLPTVTVAADGTWSVDVSSLTLVKDDVIQFFLEDQSGQVSGLPNPPSTNTTVGNIEPASDMTYRDATFKAATKVIVLEDLGELSLLSVPSMIDFGTNKITSKTVTYQPTVTGDLIVSDTRGADKKDWKLTLSQSKELVGSKNSLAENLYYQKGADSYQITTAPQIIDQDKLTTEDTKNISDTWKNGDGLKLVVPVEKQLLDQYQGTLTWTLTDAP